MRNTTVQHKDKGITQMGNTTTQQYNNKIKELPR
jgi:hypothetical protein